MSTWRTFYDKERIASEGQRGHSFFVILAGTAHETIGGHVVHTVGVGDCVGESAYLSGGFDIRRKTAAAHGNVTALEISVAQMRHMSSGCRMRLDQAFLKVLNTKLNAAYDRVIQAADGNKPG